MYRLLIVTGDKAQQDMLSAMDGWQAMGFKPPQILSTADEAMDYLSQRSVDAIAVEQTPALHAFRTYLDEKAPHKPLFEIASSAEEQRERILELYRLLTRLSADDSNDEYDDAYKLQLQRERWLKRVIGGLVASEQDMVRQMQLYRCRERVDVPCVLARLELPEDDAFLSSRWHYGSERLETALRNFFGFEHDHMLMHVAVVSQEEVRVLCYPSENGEGVSENAAFDYVQETLEQIDHYLGLHMNVLEMRRVPGLAAFASHH